jgi:hypothetical protein
LRALLRLHKKILPNEKDQKREAYRNKHPSLFHLLLLKDFKAAGKGRAGSTTGMLYQF